MGHRTLFRTAVLCLLSAAVALGDDRGYQGQDWGNDHANRDNSGFPEPRYQMGLGLGYRIDDLDSYDYTPTFKLQIVDYLSKELALTGLVTYTNHTRLEDEISYRSVAFGLGVRLQPPRRTLLPHVEAGLWVPHYSGIRRGRRYDDWQTGFRLGVGYSIEVGKRHYLDLTLAQVLNHIFTTEDMVLTIGSAPCPQGDDCGLYYRSPPDGAYNATSLEATFRFGL